MNASTISAAPAFTADDENCVYSDVTLNGQSFTVQISRPRHPSNIGEQLNEGAAIYTDEGHDDNSDLFNAVEAADLDWDEVCENIIEQSGAEQELK